VGHVVHAKGQRVVPELPPDVVVGEAAAQIVGGPGVGELGRGVRHVRDAVDTSGVLRCRVAHYEVVGGTEPSVGADLPGALVRRMARQLVAQRGARKPHIGGDRERGQLCAPVEEIRDVGGAAHVPTGQVHGVQVTVGVEEAREVRDVGYVETAAVEDLKVRVAGEPRCERRRGDLNLGAAACVVGAGVGVHDNLVDGAGAHGGQPRESAGLVRNGLVSVGILYIYI